MSFLSPIYALAGLAIALPILFHLIRRRPKERKLMSSLMFLDPTPPRLTRQSRIDQWLLLLLRATAIGLLALAFTRPYWNEPAEKDTDRIGVQRMLLIDSSASMRRDGLWDTAVRRSEQIIRQAGPTDVLSVYQFDSSLRPLVAIDSALQTPASQRQQQAITALKGVSPTWQHTDLGLSLLTAADLLQTDWDSSSESNATESEIVVVTDFQNGAMVERLAEYAWPTSCKVRIERVDASGKGNARACLLEADDPIASEGERDTVRSAAVTSLTSPNDSEKIRVRVSNTSSATLDALRLQWLDGQMQPIESSRTTCRVPAGSSLTVRMPAPPNGSTALQLEGDGSEFDNQFYFSHREPSKSDLLCIESAKRQSEASLGYFLGQLPMSDASRAVTFVSREPGATASWPTSESTPLIVASSELVDSDFDALVPYMRQGGNLLWVWDAVASPSYEVGMQKLAGTVDCKVSEAKVRQYAMLESVDFKHPLFADLADSKFNDFSKLRFWKHRRLETLPVDEWRVLAKFDDGSPALVCKEQGKGRLWILLAGWQPEESQLALSTKFVPLISGMYRLATPAVNSPTAYRVGTFAEVPSDDMLFDPKGKELEGERDASKTTKRYSLLEPGLYRRVTSVGIESTLAVNLLESESNTAVGGFERLEKLGVVMSESKPKKKTDDASKRQLRAVELESQQGWWRWVIVGVIGVIGLESLMCIRKAS